MLGLFLVACGECLSAVAPLALGTGDLLFSVGAEFFSRIRRRHFPEYHRTPATTVEAVCDVDAPSPAASTPAAATHITASPNVFVNSPPPINDTSPAPTITSSTASTTSIPAPTTSVVLKSPLQPRLSAAVNTSPPRSDLASETIRNTDSPSHLAVAASLASAVDPRRLWRRVPRGPTATSVRAMRHRATHDSTINSLGAATRRSSEALFGRASS